jgi:hypothetical protein
LSSFLVYADEAWTHDPDLRFWRFYGGAMLRSEDRERLNAVLLEAKAAVGLHGELAWTDVRAVTWERIAFVLDRFFDLVDQRLIKLRYMWIDQLFQRPGAITEHHEEHGYFILYYFFIVFAFGLPWHTEPDSVTLQVYPDEMPQEASKREQFRRFLMGCHGFARFNNASLFRIIDVGDVDSKKHIILQCVDLVIGAMGFKLNKVNLVKQANGRRAVGTRAKEKLYKYIVSRLGPIYMAEHGTRAWGAGVNSGTQDFSNRWTDKFRQWNFRQPGAFNPAWVRRH